jgi:predicted ATP-grasp superfamily ATP-dependent carboligase
MKTGAFEIIEPVPELVEPHALAMLRPWVDVGSVGTLLLRHMEKHAQSRRLAQLERPGNYYDFTRYRPMMHWSQGRRHVTVPNSYITYGRGSQDKDLVFLHMLEPHMFGEDYVDSVLKVLTELGTRRYYLLGSMYDFVPHTRPLLVTGAATGKEGQEQMANAGVSPSDYAGPTTICYLISQRLAEAGVECLSLIVHLPQYVSFEEDYAGALRLMEVMSHLYAVPVDQETNRLAGQQHERLDSIVSDNPQLQEIVSQLEARYDARIERARHEDLPALSPEVERFLREMEKRFRQS